MVQNETWENCLGGFVFPLVMVTCAVVKQTPLKSGEQVEGLVGRSLGKVKSP